MRGRKPDNPGLKVLKGAKADASRPARPSVPKCPEHLDEIAREEWERIVPELLETGVLTRIDAAALAVYCSAYSRWIRANQEIAALGVVASTDLGSPKTNPAVAVARDSEAIMLKVLADFGCNPLARNRVKSGATENVDELSVFLQRKKEA